MKRNLLRLLVALCSLLFLASIILWPISYFFHVSIARTGRSSLVRLSAINGQLFYLYQGGPGTADLIARQDDIRPPQWEAWSRRAPNYHFDSYEQWRQSLRFYAETRQLAAAGGRPITQRMLAIPFWATAWATAILPAITLQRFLRRRHRLRKGLCLRCGYDIRATPDRCPECGAEKNLAFA